MAESIASYRERRFDGVRRFELFPDRVAIEGRLTFRSEFSLTVPLDGLRPHVNQLKVRHRAFFMGEAMLALGGVGAGVAAGCGAPLAVTTLIAVTLAVPGALFMACTARRVRFAQFVTMAGAVAFDVAASGPDAATWAAFVERVAATVRHRLPPDANDATPRAASP